VSSQAAEWLDRLQEEHNNLLEALRWANTPVSGSPGGSDATLRAEVGLRICGAIWRFWKTRGYLREARALLDAALQAAENAHPTADKVVEWARLRANALYAAGNLAEMVGELEVARRHRDASLRLYQVINDRKGIAAAHNDLGDLLLRQHRPAEARRYYAESLALRRELGDKVGTSVSLNDLGNVALAQGDYTAARSFHEESLAIRREVGWTAAIPSSLTNLAEVARHRGDYAAASHMLDEALALVLQFGDRSDTAQIQHCQGVLAAELRDFPRARGLLEAALAALRELGDRQGVAYILHHLGTVSQDTGEYGRAHSLYKESLEILWGMGDRRVIAENLEMLGGIAQAMADRSGAAPESRVRAVRIWGAAAALREDAGVHLPVGQLARHDHHIAAARAQLDPTSWDRAWAEGRAMPLEEAIAYALAEGPPDA
jgi:tetratricopeptide (TPR) repeat protein